MKGAENGEKLPFQEQIDYFRAKAKEPLRIDSYKGVYGALHDKAFMVAGLTKEDILVDIKKGVDNAIAKGTSLADFKKDFDKAIQDKWLLGESDGYKGWRARIIYETNLRTSYAAGRYKQMQDMKDTHPYWQYMHGDSRKPRQDHLALNGLVVRADSAWWDAHYPPNGWGCTCYVRALSEGDMKRRGLTAIDPETTKDPNIKKRLQEAKVHEDWRHAPGREAYGNPDMPPRGIASDPSKYTGSVWVDDPVYTHQAQDTLKPGKNNGQPIHIAPSIYSASKDAQRNYAISATKKELKKIGADNRNPVTIKCGDFEMKAIIDAVGFGGHLAQDDRLAYLGYLKDMLTPQEVWTDFRTLVAPNGRRLKHALGWKMILAIDDPEYEGLMLLFLNNGQGAYEANTFYPIKNLNSRRKGRLMAKATKKSKP
jgi:hypothetical protein